MRKLKFADILDIERINVILSDDISEYEHEPNMRVISLIYSLVVNIIDNYYLNYDIISINFLKSFRNIISGSERKAESFSRSFIALNNQLKKEKPILYEDYFFSLNSYPSVGFILYSIANFSSPIIFNKILSLIDIDEADNSAKFYRLLVNKINRNSDDIDTSFLTKLPDFLNSGNIADIQGQQNWKRTFLQNASALKVVKELIKSITDENNKPIFIDEKNYNISISEKLDAVKLSVKNSNVSYLLSRKFLTRYLLYRYNNKVDSSKISEIITIKKRDEKTDLNIEKTVDCIKQNIWQDRLKWAELFTQIDDRNKKIYKDKIIRSFARFINRELAINTPAEYINCYKNITKSLHNKRNSDMKIIVDEYELSNSSSMRKYDGRLLLDVYKEIATEKLNTVRTVNRSSEKPGINLEYVSGKKLVSIWFKSEVLAEDKELSIQRFLIRKLIYEFKDLKFINNKQRSVIGDYIKVFLQFISNEEKKGDRANRTTYRKNKPLYYAALEQVILFIHFSKDSRLNYITSRFEHINGKTFIRLTDNIYTRNSRYFRLFWCDIILDKSKFNTLHTDNIIYKNATFSMNKKDQGFFSLNQERIYRSIAGNINNADKVVSHLVIEKLSDKQKDNRQIYIISDYYIDVILLIYNILMIDFIKLERKIINRFSEPEVERLITARGYIAFSQLSDILKKLPTTTTSDVENLTNLVNTTESLFSADLYNITKLVKARNWFEEYCKKV